MLTLTSFGMVQRSRPHRRDISPVVALWKAPERGFREIPLETGAHGVVLTVCADRATRRSADGRWPIDNGTHAFDVAIHQVRASNTGTNSPPPLSEASAQQLLQIEELTVLTGWAEAAAEALAHAPERAPSVLADARPKAEWRPTLGLTAPSQKLSEAIDRLDQAVQAVSSADRPRTVKAIAEALREDQPDATELDALVRRVLLAMTEERATRQPHQSPAPLVSRTGFRRDALPLMKDLARRGSTRERS